jgi:phosphate/sulfate permease
MIYSEILNIPVSLLLEASIGLNDTAQVIIAIVPLVSVIVLGILSFFFMLWDHQKRMIIIQKGGTPPSRKINEKLLLLGIVALFIGVGLTVFFIIYNGLSPSLLGGIIPTTAGLGIITAHVILYRKHI